MIDIEYHSKNVIDLRLVDLPGLISHQDTTGDRMKENIENLVLKYIKRKNTIIVHVSSLGQDFKTIHSWNFVNQHKVDKRRMLVVLTKVDVESGYHYLISTLENNPVNPGYGFIAVKARSAEDVKNDVSIEEAQKNEEEFFTQKLEYDKYANIFGSKRLALRLNNILSKKMCQTLPSILDAISKQK